jgi:hypothetical protein
MNATHNVKIGQIFSMSWGYDQTNVNYFQVVSVTAKGVYVREIGACSVPGTQGFMCEEVKPAKDRFLDRSQWCGGFSRQNEPTFRRIQPGSNNQPYFNFKGRYFARPVAEGESTYNSWYA